MTPPKDPAELPAHVFDLLDWRRRRYYDHAGENGWRIRTCRDTMQSLIALESLMQKAREMGGPERVPLLDQPGILVSCGGEQWVPEVLAVFVAIRLGGVEGIGGFRADLDAARHAAIDAILGEHGKILGRIQRLQRKAMAILEEDLRHRVPKVVN